mmetsp:Transcript_37444/g.99713  ORF Transcript_37444/g.99713 Transcript_37444/m.99713 type:complete len:201 (+) Transcript_37444:712-1314(+)
MKTAPPPNPSATFQRREVLSKVHCEDNSESKPPPDSRARQNEIVEYRIINVEKLPETANAPPDSATQCSKVVCIMTASMCSSRVAVRSVLISIAPPSLPELQFMNLEKLTDARDGYRMLLPKQRNTEIETAPPPAVEEQFSNVVFKMLIWLPSILTAPPEANDVMSLKLLFKIVTEPPWYDWTMVLVDDPSQDLNTLFSA